MVRKDIREVMFERRPEKDEEMSHTGGWRKNVPHNGNGYGEAIGWNVSGIFQEEQRCQHS